MITGHEFEPLAIGDNRRIADPTPEELESRKAECRVHWTWEETCRRAGYDMKTQSLAAIYTRLH